MARCWEIGLKSCRNLKAWSLAAAVRFAARTVPCADQGHADLMRACEGDGAPVLGWLRGTPLQSFWDHDGLASWAASAKGTRMCGGTLVGPSQRRWASALEAGRMAVQQALANTAPDTGYVPSQNYEKLRLGKGGPP